MEDDHVGHAIVEAKAEDSVLEELTDEELLDAVKARRLGSHVVEAMSDEKLADAMRVRGIKPLVDARPSGLIHELCCQGLDKNCTAEECHHEDKVGDLSHSNDAVGAHVKIIHGSDAGKKRMLIWPLGAIRTSQISPKRITTKATNLKPSAA